MPHGRSTGTWHCPEGGLQHGLIGLMGLTLSQPPLRTLAVGVYSFQGENLTDWADMAAASTIAVVPVITQTLVSTWSARRSKSRESMLNPDQQGLWMTRVAVPARGSTGPD